MNKFIKLLLLSIFLVFVLQGTVFASELPSSNNHPQKEDKIRCKGCRATKHYAHSAARILENKFGIKVDDIEKAKADGKTFFDLAKSKGMNESDLKAAIISPKLKALEESVKTGQLTKEKAEEIKTKIKEEIEKWDGKIEDFKKRKENNIENKPNINEQAS